MFVESAGVWTLDSDILPTQGEVGGEFGFATDLDGDTLVVGAPGESGLDGANEGGVYVFDLTGGSPLEIARLVATNTPGGESGW